jgi:hypothetical protein
VAGVFRCAQIPPAVVLGKSDEWCEEDKPMNHLTETANGNAAIDESAEPGFGTLLVAEDAAGG